MPGRKVGRGSSKKPLKTKALKPVKVKVPKPVKVKPVEVKPGKVVPTPRFIAPPLPPQKIAPKPPSKTPLILPQRIEIGPRKPASSPRLKTSSSSPSLKSSTKTPFLPYPSTHYPPVPNKFSASSSTSKLKSAKSVPDFAGLHPQSSNLDPN